MIRPSIPRQTIAFAAALVLLAAASPAFAAPPSPEDVAAAEALFRDGKTLLQQGKFDEACPKLAESQRLDPAGGTLLTLGLCYEAAGKTATAWVVFGDALVAGERDKRPDRVKLAREHAAALEKKLSYLTVELAPGVTFPEGLVVTRDGAPLSRVALGTAIPADPGKHVVAASAPRFLPRSVEIVLGTAGDRQKVTVPALEPEPAPPPSDPPKNIVLDEPPKDIVPPPLGDADKPAPAPSPALRYAAIGLGALSVVSLGVGAYFGIRAKSEHDDAVARCPASPCPDDVGITKNEDARKSAVVANVTIGAGVVALAGGVVLWLVAPKAEATKKTGGAARVTALPFVGPDGAGMFVGGHF